MVFVLFFFSSCFCNLLCLWQKFHLWCSTQAELKHLVCFILVLVFFVCLFFFLKSASIINLVSSSYREAMCRREGAVIVHRTLPVQHWVVDMQIVCQAQGRRRWKHIYAFTSSILWRSALTVCPWYFRHAAVSEFVAAVSGVGSELSFASKNIVIFVCCLLHMTCRLPFKPLSTKRSYPAKFAVP